MPSHSDTRSRSGLLARGAIWLIAGRVTTAGCGVIQVPLVLRALDTESFGLWVALSGLVWTLSILDGGVGFALQNRMATALAQGDRVGAEQLRRYGERLLTRVATAVAIIGVVGAWFAPWTEWFQLSTHSTQADALRAAMSVAVVLAAIALPLSVSTRAVTAAQKTSSIGLWTSVSSALALVSTFVISQVRPTLPWFVFSSGLLAVGLHFGVWLQERIQRSETTTTGISPERVAGIAKESALFFLPQLGAAFIGNFVPTLVASFAAPAAAAAYGVLQRLFGLAVQLHALALQPVWPAYTHAAARGDRQGLRSLYRTSVLVTWLGFVAPLLLLPLITPDVLDFWLGPGRPATTPTLLWSVALWNALQCIGQVPAALLNGLGLQGRLAAVGWLGILVSFGLCHILGPLWGATGILAALAISYVGLNLPTIYWRAHRALHAASPDS